MTDFSEVLEGVPDWKKYYTLDELRESSGQLTSDYPGMVELLNLGKSTGGEEIECLKIGDGRFNALIHGFPNPEEPFGGNLLDYLSWALAEDDELREELDYTWYIVKCSDPDGARRNEGFQVGPYTPMNFTLNYYRTPNTLTAESCFPYRFGPLNLDDPVPETLALMTLMDRIPFDFVSSLHMMKWGGITYEVPEPCPELYPPLWEVAKKFHVFPRKRLGTTLASGIQLADYFSPARGWVRQWVGGNTNLEPIRGCYIYEYGLMRNPKLFMMVPECCIWHDERMWNDELSDSTVWDLAEYGNERGSEANEFMVKTWKQMVPHLVDGSPFKVMMEEWMEPIIEKYTNVTDPPFTFNEKIHARRATVAEKIGMEGRADLYRMFYLGGMIRAAEHQLEQGGDSELGAMRDEIISKLEEYEAFLNKYYDVKAHPIRNLVGMSLGSILHSMEYVKSKKLWY
jgi:hypothetical protein